MLDNAIEAAEETEEKLLYIGLYRGFINKYGTEMIIMRIANSCPEKPNIDKLFNLGYSTKHDGKERGTGLFGVEKILSKYDNCILETYYDDRTELFTQEIRITSIFLYYPVRRTDKLLIYVYLSICQFIFRDMGQNIIFFAVGGVLLIIAIFNKPFYLNIALSLSGYLIAILLNYILLFILNLSGITMAYLHKYNYFSLFFMIIYTLLTVICTYYIGKYLRYRLHNNVISLKQQFPFLILIILCSIIFAFNIIKSEKEGYSSNIMNFNMLLFVAFSIITLINFFFIFRAIKKKQEISAIKQERQLLESHAKKIEDLYEEMRIFKHNHKYILEDMQYCISQNDRESLTKYFYTDILPNCERLTKNNIDITINMFNK